MEGGKRERRGHHEHSTRVQPPPAVFFSLAQKDDQSQRHLSWPPFCEVPGPLCADAGGRRRRRPAMLLLLLNNSVSVHHAHQSICCWGKDGQQWYGQMRKKRVPSSLNGQPQHVRETHQKAILKVASASPSVLPRRRHGHLSLSCSYQDMKSNMKLPGIPLCIPVSLSLRTVSS